MTIQNKLTKQNSPSKIPNAQVREESSERNTTWVSHHTYLQQKYKQGISIYSVSHFIDFGQVVQLGSGTTLNALMSTVIDYQKTQRKPLDLTILTTNLEIAQMGKEAAENDPKVFGSTQVIITGGILLPSLNSLVGNYAADNVRSHLIDPDIVFLGVAGISFEPPNGRITYHFDQELKTQESYATRPTRKRIVLCDHTKLGRSTRWRAEASVKSLAQNTEEKCTILSSYPDKSDKQFSELEEVIAKQKEMFKGLIDSWDDVGEKLSLLFVNTKGEVIEEISK